MKLVGSRLWRYVVAGVSVAAAVLLAVRLRHSQGQLAYPFMFTAIMASAWYGGAGPGLFAAAAAGLASTYYLLPPFSSPRVTRLGDLLHLGLFALAAVLIGSLLAGLQAARRRLEAEGANSTE